MDRLFIFGAPVDYSLSFFGCLAFSMAIIATYQTINKLNLPSTSIFGFGALLIWFGISSGAYGGFVIRDGHFIAFLMAYHGIVLMSALVLILRLMKIALFNNEAGKEFS